MKKQSLLTLLIILSQSAIVTAQVDISEAPPMPNREQFQERLQNMTPEQRAQMQERRANMSEEDRAQRRQQMQERFANMSEEDRAQMRQRRQNGDRSTMGNRRQGRSRQAQ